MADVDVRLSERADSAATCVFCHEALGARAIACDGCGVGLHAACRDEASRCPTLGCGQTWDHRPDAALANRTHVTPLAGFALIVRGADGRRELGLDLSGSSRKLKTLTIVLGSLIMFALLMIQGAELARRAPVTRAVEDPIERAQREETARAAKVEVASTPLVVAGAEEETWRGGSLEPFARAADLTLVDTRRLMAGLRQRALAALPPLAADAWATHGVGSTARARFVFDRLERGVRDGRPFDDGASSSLEASFELVALRDDAIDLRVTVEDVTWTETWPRAVDAALRLAVLRDHEDPTSVVVLNRISRQVRAVSARADGVRVQVFHEDGLPLPWHATAHRDLDGERTYRVELELLEWRPAQ